MEDLILLIDWFFLFYFLALNLSYAFLVILSFKEIIVQKLRLSVSILLDAESNRYTPPISIIAPAFNEEATILTSVRALLSLNYPEFEVIVVNDDSKDSTLRLLTETFNLYHVEPICRSRLESQPIRSIYRSKNVRNLIVVDKENGGKADALNCGLNVAKFPLFCGIDADTLILPDALLKLVTPFIEDPIQTIVSGGTIRVANDCTVKDGQVQEVHLPKNPWARFQVVEYLRAFLFGRIGWNSIGGTLIISGAFGLFRRDTVIDSGGYEHRSVGEDMELIVRLHRLMRQKRRPYHIKFVWESVCYTEVPEDSEVLSRQRDRWQRGLMDTLWRHRVMMFNPRYGVIGMLSFPFFFIFELLGPIIEILGLLMISISYLLGFLDITFMLLFLVVSMLFGSIISVGTLVLEEISFGKYQGNRDFMRLVLFAFLENVGYRQMTLVWRVKGIWAYLRGDRRWGKMKRKGFEKS
jgi:cellulose synthase/poly-beta-1,6-N-acetylglucosamine synthase-like glycosyltransferase